MQFPLSSSVQQASNRNPEQRADRVSADLQGPKYGFLWSKKGFFMVFYGPQKPIFMVFYGPQKPDFKRYFKNIILVLGKIAFSFEKKIHLFSKNVLFLQQKLPPSLAKNAFFLRRNCIFLRKNLFHWKKLPFQEKIPV